MTLTSLREQDYERLFSALRSLRPMKPGKYYPATTVSKFLHFFNPMLFPIYDTAVIDKQVMGRGAPFNGDYWRMVRERAPSWIVTLDRDNDYYLRYLVWASYLIKHGGETSMSVFADWYRAMIAGHRDPSNVGADLRRYEATAFEFAIIGAAML